MPKRFGLSDTEKWVAEDGVHEIQSTERDLPIRIDPEAEVLSELRMEDGNPLRAVHRCERFNEMSAPGARAFSSANRVKKV